MKNNNISQTNHVTASGTTPTNIVGGEIQYFNNYGTIEEINIFNVYVSNGEQIERAETENSGVTTSFLKEITKSLSRVYFFIWKHWDIITKITPIGFSFALAFRDELEILFHNLRI